MTLTLANTAKIVTKPQSSFTELIDNQEGIILDLENLHYYTLNSTAVFLWKKMRSGAAGSVESLSDALSNAFNINVNLAEFDTHAFLDELESNGLITYAETEDDPRVVRQDSLDDLPAYEPPQLRLSNTLTQVILSGSSTIATAAIATGGQ